MTTRSAPKTVKSCTVMPTGCRKIQAGAFRSRVIVTSAAPRNTISPLAPSEHRRPRNICRPSESRLIACRPAVFGMFGAQGQLLAIADGRHAIRRDSEGLQIFLGRLCSLGAKGDIVFLGAALVTMTLDLNAPAWIFLQPVGITVQDFTVFGADRVVIVVEMNIG